MPHFSQGHEREHQLRTSDDGHILRREFGMPLKNKAGNVCSTTRLAVAFGGNVNMSLLINEAYEGFGFFRRPRIDVAQEPIQIAR